MGALVCALTLLISLAASSAAAQTCPDDAGKPCDGASDTDLCTEGTVVCNGTVATCTGEGPLIYLPFEEGSGAIAINAADVMAGDDAQVSGIAWVPGLNKQGMLWTGDSETQFIRIKKADAPGTKFTWMFQLFPDKAGGKYVISRTSKASTNALAYSVNGDLHLEGGAALLTGALTSKTWTHVAITYDGANLKLYRDGELEFTEARVVSPEWVSDVWIGQEQDAHDDLFDKGQAYVGRMDDVHFYDYALTQAAIKSVAGTGEPQTRLNRELCNSDSFNNDCNDATPEPFGQTCDSGDSDKCKNGTATCKAASEVLTAGALQTECTNETEVSIVEKCNFVDDDCNGLTDDGLTVGDLCDSNDPDLCDGGRKTCDSGTNVVCGPEPIAYYTFEPGKSGANAITDVTSWHHEGVLHQGAKVTADGKFGNALTFDGTDDFARPYNSPTMRSMINDLTIAAWIFPTSVTEGTIFYKLNGWSLVRKGDGGIAFTNNSQPQPTTPFYGNAKTGEWTHVAATVKGEAVTIYINGLEAGAHTESITPGESDPVTASAPFLGCRGSGSWFCADSYFTGRMDEVLFFDRRLNATEVGDIATKGSGWYVGSNEICGFGLADDNCNTVDDDPSAVGCTPFYKDTDKDGFGAQTIVDLRPAGYWPMDELDATGRFSDWSGNGFHMARRTGRRVLGQVGAGWETDGFDPMSDLRTTTALQGSQLDISKTLSAAAWVKPKAHNTVPGGSTIISKGNAWDFGITADGALRLQVGNTSALTTAGDISVGSWTHVAFSYDESSVVFYKNGSPLKTVAFGATLKSSAEDLVIGRHASFAVFNRRFDGILDEVAVFSRALNGVEVATIQSASDHACLCAASASFPAGKRGDCSDGVAAINPDAAEICDGKDNNCSGLVDDFKPTACVPAAPATACQEGLTQCVGNAEVCTPRPAIHLRLDEGSGQLAHSSTSEGPSGEGAGLTWSTGKFGKAITLDTGNNLTIRAPSGVATEGAVAMWVKTGGNPHTMSTALFQLTGSRGKATDPAKLLFMGIAGDELFVRSASGKVAVPAAPHVPKGKWVHVAATWSLNAGANEAVSLYVGGERVKTTVFDVGTGAPFIMLGPGPGQGSLGVMDDVVVYDYAPRTAIIAALATTGVPAGQDNREACDSLDNDCDGFIDEPTNPWATFSGTATVGEACQTADKDSCTEGKWACTELNTGKACLDGPIGYYDFDLAGSSSVFDQAGDSSTGALNGATKVSGGKSGLAVKASSTTGSAFVTHPAPSLNNRRGTLAFWVKPTFDPTSFATAKGLFTVGTGAKLLSLTHTSTTELTLQYGGEAPLQISAAGRFFKDTWAHIGVTWSQDTGAARVYVNGSLVGLLAAIDFSLIAESTGGTATLGSTAAGAYDGLFDQYTTYRRDLSATEIAALVAAPPPAAERNAELCDNKDNNCSGGADEAFNKGGACDSATDEDVCQEGTLSCADLFNTGCPNDGPVAYYKLDNSPDAELVDSSGKHMHAVRSAGIANAAGKKGTAQSFDGLAAHVKLPDFRPLHMTGTAQTIALWVRPTNDAAGVLVHKGGHYGLRRNADGTISYGNNAQAFCLGCYGAKGFVPKDNWSHVAAVWNGSTVTYYINGSSFGSAALAGTMTDTTSLPFLGCFGGPSNGVACTTAWFKGDMDDVVLYDYALSGTEVLQLVTDGVPDTEVNALTCTKNADCQGGEDDLGSLSCTTYWSDGDSDGAGGIPNKALGAVAYYPMDVLKDATITDLTGKKNDGTRTNALLRRDGKRGKAMAFDGKSTASNIWGSDSASLDMAAAITITAWVKPANLGANAQLKPIFVKRGAYDFSIDTAGKLSFSWPGVTTDAVTGPSVTTGTWNWVAVTWSKSSGIVSLQQSTGGAPVQIQKTGLTGTGATSNFGWGIGQYPASADPRVFDGMIDEVYVFNKALTGPQLDTIRTNNSHTCRCAAGTTHTAAVAGDCNDDNSAVAPGKTEACDGVDQNCNGQIDEGANAACDDGKTCTVDSCTASGTCSSTPKTDKCLIDTVCYDTGTQKPGSPCFSCDPAKSGLVWSPKDNNSVCSDSDACTTNDICTGGTCKGTTLSCDDGNVCTTDSCVAASGCKNVAIDGGTQDCYTGADGTKGVGLCIGGTATCNNGNLSACKDEITPVAELCDGVDNNCNGVADEAFKIGQTCDEGDRDKCKSGVMECVGTGSSRCIDDGPIVWLPFDEVNDTTTSNPSWGGKNSFLESGAKQGDGPTGFGKAAHLDGINDYVAIQDYSELVGSPDLTFSMWLRRDAAEDHVLLGKLTSGGAVEIMLGIIDGKLVLRRGTTTLDSGIEMKKLGSWVHVAVTVTKTTVSFFINGDEYRRMASVGTTSISASTSWLVGFLSGVTTKYLKGAVDEVRIYKGAADPKRIMAETKANGEVCTGTDSDCDGLTDEGFNKAAGACDSGDADKCSKGTGRVCHPQGGSVICTGDGPTRLYPMETLVSGTQAAPAAGAVEPLLFSGATTLVTGKTGIAVKLGGAVHGRARVDSTATGASTAPGLIAAWVRFDATGDMAVLSKSKADGTVEYLLGRKGGRFWVAGPGTDKVFAKKTLPNNTWHHVALRMSGTTMTPLLNGVSLGDIDTGSALTTVDATSPIYGGRWDGSKVVNPLTGALDYVAEYATDPGQDALAALVNLGEACNGIDDNCDNTKDEGFENAGQACTGGSSTCVVSGVQTCNASKTALECTGSFKPAGESCDDGDLCTKNDECDGAITCAGVAYVCNDQLAETTDTCNGDGNCTFTPNAGFCVIGGKAFAEGAIDPDNPCKGCFTATSQKAFSPRPDDTACSDASSCTENDKCTAGVCAGTPKTCNDSNTCTTDSCTEADGCLFTTVADGTACDDGKPCTVDTICTNKSCGGGKAKDCNDNNPCTSDACNATGGCVNTIIPFTQACYAGPAGTKGVGICKAGLQKCTGSVLGACVGQVTPVTELCDSVDNDCDGTADEDFSTAGNACDGGDDDDCANGVLTCSADKKSLECIGDVNQAEICDLKDNNCDGQTDEGFSLGQACDGAADVDSCKEGVTGCAADGTTTCTKDGPTLLYLADDVGDVVYTTADDSGNGLTGELKGAMGFGTGVRGRGLLFDGVDDHVAVPVSPKLVLGKTFTLAVHFNLAGGTNAVSLLEAKTGTNSDFFLRVNAAGSPYAVVEESIGGFASLPSGTTITKGQWQHVALTADGKNFRLYVNGALKKTVAQKKKPIESGQIFLGKLIGGVDQPMKGLLDEVGVWSYALTAAQIAALNSGGIPAINRNIEICDSKDNNCDTNIDEHSTAELCDGVDNNCNGTTDEAFATKGVSCDDGGGDVCTYGKQICTGAGTGVYCAGDSPLFWWRLETASGTSATDYAGGGTGTITGATWTAGQFGQALKFAGAGSVSMAAGYTGADPANAVRHMTVEGWAKLGVGATGVILERPGAYKLSVADGTKITCEYQFEGGTSAKAEASTSTVTWHHLACPYDGGAVRLYIDGKLAALTRTTGGAGVPLSNKAVPIGTGPVKAGASLLGDLDELAVWDVVLSEAEIKTHVASGIPKIFIVSEICDTKDNDCDLATDEGFEAVGNKCDTDDEDTCANGTNACTVAGALECQNDVPGNGVELCDGIDNDCDGTIDEGFENKGKPCDGNDDDKCANGTSECSADKTTLVCVNDVTIAEICDGLDNNCDGSIDEGFKIGQACDGADADKCLEGVFACKADKSGAFCSSDGPRVLFPTNEGSGSTTTSLTGDNVVGTFVGNPEWVTGKTGKALKFDTAGEQVSVPSSAANSLGLPLSFGGWVKYATAETDSTVVISKGDIKSPNYSLEVSGKAVVGCRVTGASPAKCTANLGLNMLSFHLFLCVYDGDNMKVYADGKLVKTCKMKGTPVQNSDPLTLGANGDNLKTPVTLDDFQVWDKAITPAQVASIFTGGDACDGLDNDCDGSIDEDFADKGAACDGDDNDKCKSGTNGCAADLVTLTCTGDTNIVETCDLKDNDCDGAVDEDFTTLGTNCDSDDDDKCANGTVTCLADGSDVECTGDVTQSEVCDGLDNDCNGLVDDKVPGLGVACDGADTDTCSDGINFCNSVTKQVECDDIKSAVYLPLDEPAGTTTLTEQSRSRQAMKALGNPTFGAAGKMGKAVTFGSAAQRIEESVGGTFTRLNGVTGATFAAWVKHATPFLAGQSETIVAQWGGASDNQSFTFRVVSNGLELGLRTSEAASAAATVYQCIPGQNGCTALVKPGVWTHVAAVLSGQELRFYVDGVPVKATPTAGTTVTAPTTQSTLTVGSDFGTANGFNGSLDDVLVYPRALTEAELAALVAASPTGDTPELCNGVDDTCEGNIDEGHDTKGAACDGSDPDACTGGVQVCSGAQTGTICDDTTALLHWTLDDGAGIRVRDHSGGGNDAILYNNATFTTTAKVGGGLTMVGDSKPRAQAAKTVDLLGGKKQWTIAAWIKPAAVDGGTAPILSTYGTAKTWVFGQADDGLFFRGTLANTPGTPEGICKLGTPGCTTLLTKGTWHHAVLTYFNGTARMYVDGTFKRKYVLGNDVLTAKSADDRLMLGATGDVSLKHFNGVLDDVQVLPTRLLDAEVLALFNKTQGNKLELCNGKDDDCDGKIDEDFDTLAKACDGNDNDECAKGTATCKADGSGVECINETVTNLTEACNGTDDDCDGDTDEGFGGVGEKCDGGDDDLCKEGVFVCNGAGNGVVCQRDGPIRLYRFDDGEGLTAFDTAGGTAKDLTLKTIQWETGKFGKALRLTGVAGSQASATLSVGGTATVELWMRSANSTQTAFVFSQGTDAASHFSGQWGTDSFLFRLQDGTQLRTVSAPLPAKEWHHVALVMEPGKADGLRLYVDCALQQGAPLTTNVASGEFLLGKLAGNAVQFDGHVDELAIHDYAVKPATLCVHAATGVGAINENRELCDVKDNDCNLKVDDTLVGKPGDACDGSDTDKCAKGTYTCKATKIDAECINETETDIAEICDGVDNNCDNQIDEIFTYKTIAIGQPCDPGGVCGPGTVECLGETKATCSTIDGSEKKASLESCNNVDDDCDGLTDENFDGQPLSGPCYTGVPKSTKGVGVCKGGTNQCVAGDLTECVGQVTPKALDDTCDGKDDDCDGETDEDFSDGIACTKDTCVNGVPTSVPDNSLCDDNKPCTLDTCTAIDATAGGCSFTNSSSLTPDPAKHGKPCKKAICQAGEIVYSVDDTASADDGLDCTANACQAGDPVVSILDGNCLIEGACHAAGAINKDDACKVCAPETDNGKWTGVVHQADFDKGGGITDGYTQNELQNGGITWGVSPARFVGVVDPQKAKFSYYFGNGATKKYESGARVAAEAISPLIRMPAGVKLELTFFVWMETEGYTGSEKFDTLRIDVSDVTKGTTTKVWNSMDAFASNTKGVFRKINVDLSAFAGSDVNLKFVFDSGDALFNNYEGVYLDQIRVETGCCLGPEDCEDGVNETIGSCVKKQCVQKLAIKDCIPRQTSVVLLVDKSESMLANSGTGQSRWDATASALNTVLADYDQKINMGFKLYPTADASDACLVSAGLDLDFHTDVSTLNNILSGVTPSGQTPMASSLTQAINAYKKPAVVSEAGNKYVILLTDGLETCGGDVLGQVGTLRGLGIRTILVAFDTVASKPVLNKIALKGGMAQAPAAKDGPVYFRAGADVAGALKKALDLTISEVCNELDDNCNGKLDDNVPEIACNLTCNSGSGGVQKCFGGSYSACTEQVQDEICDGKDNDCNGVTDEDWPDLGKACSIGQGACFSTGKFICPGLGTGNVICDAVPKPGSIEQCNGKDDDCDSLIDEEITEVCTTDCGSGTKPCVNGEFGECTAVAPKDETCNGIDDDCNGVIDDIVPIPCTGICGPGFKVCVLGELGGCSATGSADVCDGKDNDCDGKIDNDLATGGALTQECTVVTTLVGECAKGKQTCTAGTFSGVECKPNQESTPEVCDGVDNDCDGVTDNTASGDPVSVACYADEAGVAGPVGTKGVGVCKEGTQTCGSGVEPGKLGKCIGAVLPGIEICNGKDDNCSGVVDEDPGTMCKAETVPDPNDPTSTLPKYPVCALGTCQCSKDLSGAYSCFLD